MSGATITSLSLGRGHGGATAAPAVPQLIVALACDQPHAPPSRHLLDGIDEVVFGRGERAARRDVAARRLVLRLPDARMSSDHGRLVRARGAWTLDDPRSKNGVVLNGAPTRAAVLGDGDVLELGHTFCLFRVAPAADGAPDVDADALAVSDPTLATFNGELAAAFARLARVAATDVPVLIAGDTGTGKELVARAVHRGSGRAGAFVAVNCGALPESLVEGELFGARKGAFSGATHDRPGLVRAADHGTLFLDEIAELRAPSQAALLRVLQEREVLPLGDTTPVAVDVRVVAATHRRLDQRVADGAFRDDLYARLNGYAIELPPLRARREDLGLLVRALLARRPGGAQATLSPAAARLLFAYAWPHNVRELEKTIASALALAPDRPIGVDDLPPAVRRGVVAPPAPPEDDDALRARLVALLAEHQGNVAAVARALGKERMQIHRWAKRLGIDLATRHR
ncbi:MAG: sigma 54-interacting transcriptional regulator [Myxococcales bacterium]|nr:sigma 54-interacting transcriptional regulator [Myxococcales bacterium]